MRELGRTRTTWWIATILLLCTSRDLQGGGFNLKRKTTTDRDLQKHVNASINATDENPDLRAHGKGFILKSTSYAYVIELTLGTPPKPFEFLVDTGSSTTAIAGPRCQNKQGYPCSVDKTYDPSLSSTSYALHRPVKVEYGKGAWSGEVYRDVISFQPGPSVVTEFAVIIKEKEFFLKNSVNEGILGLGYRTLSTGGIMPIMDQLTADKKADDIFSISLCNGMGELWLSEPTISSYIHPIKWTRVIHRAWYTVQLTGIDVAGESLGLSPYNYPPAIVDSGTTDVLLDHELYYGVISLLRKFGPAVDSRFWKNYCVETDPYKWPFITLYLKDIDGGSFPLVLLGKHYVRQQGRFHCLSIGPKPSGVVLGEVAMEGNVVVFDRSTHRVGFAPSNATDADTGHPCGNPIKVNTTVTGHIWDFCQYPSMPDAVCYQSCASCVKARHAWCPSGNVVIWTSGVKNILDAPHGFCWPGGFFGFHHNRFLAYLPGHGSVEIELDCNHALPMFLQCKVHGEAVLIAIVVGVIFLTLVCVCIFCMRLGRWYEKEEHAVPPQSYLVYPGSRPNQGDVGGAPYPHRRTGYGYEHPSGPTPNPTIYPYGPVPFSQAPYQLHQRRPLPQSEMELPMHPYPGQPQNREP